MKALRHKECGKVNRRILCGLYQAAELAQGAREQLILLATASQDRYNVLVTY
jgi:hypothetical protein